MQRYNFVAVNLSLYALMIVLLSLLQIATVYGRSAGIILISTSPELLKSSQCCAPVFLAPIVTSGNNVYVSWSSNKTGESFEIMFRASADEGKTFGAKINLSNTPEVDSLNPSVAASGNNVYVSWWESANKTSNEPVLRISSDNGKTFGPIIHLQSTELSGNSS
jgi:hypothetical protein